MLRTEECWRKRHFFVFILGYILKIFVTFNIYVEFCLYLNKTKEILTILLGILFREKNNKLFKVIVLKARDLF